MGAPEFVPTPAARPVRTYTSPPRRPDPWIPGRPGELSGRQPSGDLFGNQGPDQGYALVLAESLRGTLSLHSGEHESDALAGAVAVGLKRASLFGRAPILDDVIVGLAVWGYLDPDAPKDLVEVRRPMFEEIHHPHHYVRLRAVAAAVPADVLRQPREAIVEQARDQWKAVLDLG